MTAPRRVLGVIVTLAFLTAPFPARAQQPTTVPRIGLLGTDSSAGTNARLEAFRQGLRDLGYVEGQNIAIEYRWAEGRAERLPNLAVELVGLKVDVILASTTPAALAARTATRTIPIVFVSAADPVGSGLVARLSRPGGNVTGLSLLAPELVARQLQLLKEVAPNMSRVTVLSNPDSPNNALLVKETVAAARSLGVQVQLVGVRGTALDDALSAISKERPAPLFALFDPILFTQRTRIVEFANQRRLPAIYGHREFAESGGLMAYGPDLRDNFRRGASYVDRILKGAKPADLPVEQPRKFELVLNLKTAKTLALTIPPAVLARVDEVIE